MSKIVVIGSSNTDMVAKAVSIPGPGETVLGDQFFTNPGGKGANQAIVASRMGGAVKFVGRIVEDIFGKQLLENLNNEGIDTQHVSIDEHTSSGVALIALSEQGENAITVAVGSNNTLTTIHFNKVILLKDRYRDPYGGNLSDMEAIRYVSSKKQWLIGDEGGTGGTPAIHYFNTEGKLIKTLPLDSSYTNNIIPNKGFEALFSSGEKVTFFATETPLLTDGAMPSFSNGGLLRIMAVNTSSNQKEGEWLYDLGKIPQKPNVEIPSVRVRGDNGLSELLSIDDNQFLALERSGVPQKGGTYSYVCKLFLLRLDGHANAKGIRHTYKTLLIDFSTLPHVKTNIKGMCFGPVTDGERTLIFVSDNNFKKNIPTRFYLFKISL